ncbi:MAG: hypothetical protein EBU76_08610 [Gammaproteobacteria bacterium]|nr:hypothetical protein [Gammaproteobacteria bacterium]
MRSYQASCTSIAERSTSGNLKPTRMRSMRSAAGGLALAGVFSGHDSWSAGILAGGRRMSFEGAGAATSASATEPGGGAGGLRSVRTAGAGGAGFGGASMGRGGGVGK